MRFPAQHVVTTSTHPGRWPSAATPPHAMLVTVTCQTCLVFVGGAFLPRFFLPPTRRGRNAAPTNTPHPPWRGPEVRAHHNAADDFRPLRGLQAGLDAFDATAQVNNLMLQVVKALIQLAVRQTDLRADFLELLDDLSAEFDQLLLQAGLTLP